MSTSSKKIEKKQNGDVQLSAQERHLISLLANLNEKDYPENSEIQGFKKQARCFVNHRGEFIPGTEQQALELLDKICRTAAGKSTILPSARNDFYRAAKEHNTQKWISHLEQRQKVGFGYVSFGYSVDLTSRAKAIQGLPDGSKEACEDIQPGENKRIFHLSRDTSAGGESVVGAGGDPTDSKNFDSLNEKLTSKGLKDVQAASSVSGDAPAANALVSVYTAFNFNHLPLDPKNRAYTFFTGKKGTYSMEVVTDFIPRYYLMHGYFQLEDEKGSHYFDGTRVASRVPFKKDIDITELMDTALETGQISSRTKYENGYSSLKSIETSNQLLKVLVELPAMLTQQEISVYGLTIFFTATDANGESVRVLDMENFRKACEIAKKEDEALMSRMNALVEQYKSVLDRKDKVDNELLEKIQGAVVRHYLVPVDGKAEAGVRRMYSAHIDIMTNIDLYENILNLLKAETTNDIDSFYAALACLQEISDFSGSNDLTAVLDEFLRKKERDFCEDKLDNPSIIKKLKEKLEVEKVALRNLELDPEAISSLIELMEADGKLTLLDKVELCDMVYRMLVCPKSQLVYLVPRLEAMINRSENLKKPIDSLLELSANSARQVEESLRVVEDSLRLKEGKAAPLKAESYKTGVLEIQKFNEMKALILVEIENLQKRIDSLPENFAKQREKAQQAVEEAQQVVEEAKKVHEAQQKMELNPGVVDSKGGEEEEPNEDYKLTEIELNPDVVDSADKKYEDARAYYTECLKAYDEHMQLAIGEGEGKKASDVRKHDPVLKSGIDFLKAAKSAVQEGDDCKAELTTIFNFQAVTLHNLMKSNGIAHPEMPKSLEQSKPSDNDCNNAIKKLPQKKSLVAAACIAVGVLLGVTAFCAAAVTLAVLCPPAGLAFMGFMAPVVGPPMLTASTAAIATLGYVVGVGIGCKIEDMNQERGLKARAKAAMNVKKGSTLKNNPSLSVSEGEEVSAEMRTSTAALGQKGSSSLFHSDQGACRNQVPRDHGTSPHKIPISQAIH